MVYQDRNLLTLNFFQNFIRDGPDLFDRFLELRDLSFRYFNGNREHTAPVDSCRDTDTYITNIMDFALDIG